MCIHLQSYASLSSYISNYFPDFEMYYFHNVSKFTIYMCSREINASRHLSTLPFSRGILPVCLHIVLFPSNKALSLCIVAQPDCVFLVLLL